MDAGQAIIVGLSVFLGVWYIAGSIINRRRGVATYHWLHAGLSTYGKISAAKWIGTSASGARLVVEAAKTPFRRAEAVFLLDSREILPLWLVNLLRRKGDEMILKADLRKAPNHQIEGARPGKLDMQKISAQAGAGANLQPVELNGIELAQWGRLPEHPERLSEPFLARYGGEILSLSLRRSNPHLIVKVKLANLRLYPAETFLEAVEVWVKAIQAGMSEES